MSGAAETTPPPPDPDSDSAPSDTTDAEAPETEHPELGPLPVPVRLVLYFVGWLLLLIGILGLALPGIQGILTILLGSALLSLASEAAHRRLRSVLKPWPKAHNSMERFRARVHGWFSRDP